MRFNRTLAFGILACLLAGLLIGASQATIQGEVDDSPMTVPTARLGERVTYGHFERPNDVRIQPGVFTVSSGGLLAGSDLQDDGQGGGSRAADNSDEPTLTSVRTHEAKALEEALDRTGERHDVLVLAYNFRLVDEEGARVQSDNSQLEYVDLGTRLAIQGHYQSSIGPPFNHKIASRWFSVQDSTLPGVEFQGLTVRLGDNLTAAYLDRQELTSGGDADFDAASSDPNVLEQSLRRWVSDRAVIDGKDAYAIRTEHRVVSRLTDDERSFFQTVFGAEAADTAAASRSETSWVSSESPYPLLLENRIVFSSAGKDFVLEDTIDALQEGVEGSGPTVPWGQDRAAHHFRDSDPTVARTPGGQPYPADGAGSRLAYPLSLALSDVRGDPRLAQFQLWRQQNPNHYLVSADLAPGERSTEAGGLTSMWRLVFATPRGDAFEVTSERLHPAAPPVTESRGAKTVHGFQASDLPDRSVTIAAAERLWTELAGEAYRDKAPNAVHWGLQLNQTSGSACLMTMMRSTSSDADEFRQLSVGYSNQGTCITQSSTLDSSQLSVHAATGNLESLFEWRSEFRQQPLGLYSDTYRAPARAQKTAFTGVHAPDVEKTAVASTSLLAVFLLVYFLPALKFVGAKGLLLVPGYAKLRKQDLLDNQIRDQILQVIRNDPGVHTTDLAERVDAGWGTTVYHLGVLEKNGLVSSLIDGRYHRFFPVGTVDFSARGQLAVMKNLRTKSIYELIAHDPGIVQESLARSIGISAPAAIFHLKRLEEVGMVGRVRKGRKVHYYANEKPIPRSPAPRDSMEVA